MPIVEPDIIMKGFELDRVTLIPPTQTLISSTGLSACSGRGSIHHERPRTRLKPGNQVATVTAREPRPSPWQVSLPELFCSGTRAKDKGSGPSTFRVQGFRV